MQIKLSQAVVVTIIFCILTAAISWKMSVYVYESNRLTADYQTLKQDNAALTKELEQCRATQNAWRPGNPIGNPIGAPHGSIPGSPTLRNGE